MNLKIQELAREATSRGINLGKNPVRTIRYYTHIGLLNRPDIERVGSANVAEYSDEYLSILDVIERYKQQGYSLAEIRDLLQQLMYWSQRAVDFMKPIIEAKGYPKDAFCTDVPITRESLAVFLDCTADALMEGTIAKDFFDSSFVDRDGQPAIPQPVKS